VVVVVVLVALRGRLAAAVRHFLCFLTLHQFDLNESHN
jgi:hypothetical protein